jgi:hypothetical protein
MGRRFVSSTFALALALSPAVLFAQAAPAQQPPAGQPPAQQPPAGQPAAAAPAQPAAPKLTFKTNAGILLVQVKPDQTAAFEEMIAKLRTGAGTATDDKVKQQASVKVYKSSEPGAGGNAFYVLLYDPASPGAEYNWLTVINSTMTPEQQRDPATRDLYTKWAASVAAMNILHLTEVK